MNRPSKARIRHSFERAAPTYAAAAVVQRRMIDTPAYGLTIIWALAGIIVANLGANLGVAVLAAVGITLMVLVILFRPGEDLT